MMKYPNMRSELVGYLEGLSDLDYQVRNWVKLECLKEGKEDCLDFTINFLFDDTDLGSNSNALIGVFLRNSEEAGSLKVLCDAIDAILDKYGTHLSDEEYIQKPEWQDVVKKASESLALIRKYDSQENESNIS